MNFVLPSKQELFQANPNLANGLPRGILQFSRAVGQMPPEILEDMLLMNVIEGEAGQLEGRGQVHGVEMPGFDFFQGEPGELEEREVEEELEHEFGVDGEGAEEYEEEEEEEEEISVRSSFLFFRDS
jgi:hypothetical protein